MPIKHPLQAFREAHDPPLSQAEAGEMVGITQSMWSLLENEKGFCHPRTAKRISDVTGIAIDRLLDFSDNKPGEDDAAVAVKEIGIAKDMP